MKEREEVAVVTGAARGIGRRVALVLAEEGFRIVANDLAAPEETSEELRSAGAKTLSVPGDVSDEAEMLERGSGSIVNVVSVAGLLGFSGRAAYNASKHSLIRLTRTLAAEWGGRGVRVNAVCPGWVKTEMDEEDQAGGGYTDADIEGRVPMARFAAPE